MTSTAGGLLRSEDSYVVITAVFNLLPKLKRFTSCEAEGKRGSEQLCLQLILLGYGSDKARDQSQGFVQAKQEFYQEALSPVP